MKNASVEIYADMTKDEIMTEFTLKGLKADLAAISKLPQFEQIANATPKNAKSPIVDTLKIISQEIKNNAKQNDATDQFIECVRSFEHAKSENDGTFFIGDSKVEILLYGKEHAQSKKQVFADLEENERTEKTGPNGTFNVPNKEVWVSHALIVAADTQGATTQEGRNMVAGNLLSGSMSFGNIGIDPSVHALMSNLLSDDGKTAKTSGLISRDDADSLVKDLQLLAPAGTSVRYIAETDDKEFASMIIYDVTPQYTPGMFKVGKGVPRITERNPTAQELLGINLDQYLSQENQKYADILVYRVNALSRFNLIRLATPYGQTILPKTGNLKDLQINHGIDRDDPNLGTLKLARNPSKNARFLDWEIVSQLLEMKTKVLQKLGYSIEVHSSIFMRGSKAEKSCDKRGRKTLEPRDVSDIKKGAKLAELYFQQVLGQGKAASIMNILASESRTAQHGYEPTGVLSNIAYLLKIGDKANKKDKSTVKALQQLKDNSVFWPFGFENAQLSGKSNGSKGEQKVGLNGKIGRNRSQLTPAMVTIGGRTVIGVKAVPLTKDAYDHRAKQSKKPTRKPARKQQR